MMSKLLNTLVKVYTKTGDRGTTSLFGGKRVDKDSARICAYGAVDELNSLIGVILSDIADLSLREENRRSNLSKSHSRLDRESSSIKIMDSRFRGNDKEFLYLQKKLLRIQGELFVLGSDLATPMEVKVKIPRITKSFATRLEKEIDKWTASISPLKNFILPGGGKIGANLHLARTVARRAERSVVELANQEKINKQSLRSSQVVGLKNAQIYINRLSDWFFTLARYTNKLEKVDERTWKGRIKT